MAVDPFELELELQLDQPRKTDIQDVKEETSFSDYIADIVRAPVGGFSRAIQGLLSLGAIPIDYVADTNLTKKIDNLFNKWTPDAQTGVGELVQTLVQFGLPLGVASKVGSGLKILKGANIRKLSDPSLTTLGKAGELAKRAGYFGALGGITDLVVSNPESQNTLAESLGLTESKDLNKLEGRERAAELLKQKIKFGAEGAAIGGVIPLLPAAGTLGYKYGIVPATKVISPVVGGTLRVVDKAVFNPMSQLIAGKGTKSLASDIISKTGGLLEKAYTKTGLPPVEKWKEFDPMTGSFTERLLKKVDNLKTSFTSAGKLQFPEISKIQSEIEAATQAEVKSLKKTQERINDTLYNIVSKFKTNIYDVVQYKASRTGNYTNIMDRLAEEKNKITEYLLAQGPRNIKETFNAINPAVKNEAKQLKEILKKSNSRYYNLLAANPANSYEELARTLADNADGFFKQRFASFNNKSFQYDPVSGPVGSKALDAVKKIILKDPQYKNKVITMSKGLSVGDEFEKQLTSYGTELLKEIKAASIRAGVDPDQYIKRVSRILKTKEADAPSLLKPGESFPDAIKRFLSQEKNTKVSIKDYENGLVDTVMYQAKQFYSKNYFDQVENILKEKGALFDATDAVTRPGLRPIVAKFNSRTGVNPNYDVAFKSTLFEGKYTYPEIANALIETKVAFDNFFDFPFYKSLMSLKAGAQVAKTIFSPMTQVRNVTTASFFPLMNGLIGGRSSLSDAWKLVAEDIFTGAKTNIEKLNIELDDMVRRGVIDQNIQVNEMRTILNKAKDGAITFESFMNNPTVKKFVDVYQGGDNIWKVYSDKFYQSALRQAFGDPKATPDQVLANVKDWYKTIAKEDFVENSIITGQKKTAEEALKDVSAYLVTNTIPTYSKVPDIIKAIRNLPLGNFVAFPAEILRTTSNVLTLGARELTSTNPYIRQMGARRVVGASATLGGIGGIIGTTAEYVTGVDKEKMDAAKRSFVPVYEKNATLIPLSKPDRDGKFKYFNFSYSNPYDSLVRPFNAILGSFSDGTLSKDNVDAILFNSLFGDPVTGRPGALSEFFAPFISESIGTERVSDIILRNGETRSGSKIFYPQENLNIKIAKSLNHIIGGLEPGAFTQARRVWEGATGTFTDAGTARNTKDELTALMSGIRIQEVKPLASMPFILTSFNKDKQNIGSKFAREVYSASTSTEDRISSFKTYLSESYDSQTKMYQTLQDARNLGIDEYELKTILEDRLTKSDADRLLKGRFKPPTYSKERFDSLIKRVSTEDLRSSFLLEDNIRKATEIFDNVRSELNYYDLNKPISDLNNYIDRIFRPELPAVRALPTGTQLFKPSTTAQGPSLPAPDLSQGSTAAVQQQPTLGQQFNLLPTQEKVDILFGR